MMIMIIMIIFIIFIAELIIIVCITPYLRTVAQEKALMTCCFVHSRYGVKGELRSTEYIPNFQHGVAKLPLNNNLNNPSTSL